MSDTINLSNPEYYLLNPNIGHFQIMFKCHPHCFNLSVQVIFVPTLIEIGPYMWNIHTSNLLISYRFTIPFHSSPSWDLIVKPNTALRHLFLKLGNFFNFLATTKEKPDAVSWLLGNIGGDLLLNWF